MVALTVRPISSAPWWRSRAPSPSPRITKMGSCAADSHQLAQSLSSRYSDWITEVLDELSDSFLITDPSIAGHPIVFASRGFESMSGYARDEILGRNGRIFQGPATDRRSVMAIREAIREERSVQINLLNYRRDGSSHWILFHLFPVFAEVDGSVIHFVAVQVPIPRRSCYSKTKGELHLLRSCRDELRVDHEIRFPFVDMDNRVLEAEEPREASDVEKEKAINAANNILSALVRCSNLTGKRVCGKRCSPLAAGVAPPLSSALILSLGRIKQSFVLTNPHLPDMPVVYASDAFLSLTGYARHEVLGHSSRFLTGRDTDVDVLTEIKESIQAERACTVRILSYRKDGSSFWNLLHISPVRNASGKVAFFIEVHFDEDSKVERHGLSPHMWQLGAVGAVKVAVRCLAAGVGPSRSSS